MADDAPNSNPPEPPPASGEGPTSSHDDQTMRAAPISADPELEHRVELSRDQTSEVVRVYIIEESGDGEND
jgi:hypothetical protein